MQPAEPGVEVAPMVMLTHAAAVPLDSAAVGAWRRRALALFDDPRPHDYRTVCDMLFESTGYAARDLCDAPADPAQTQFRCAPEDSQLDLAAQAVALLARRREPIGAQPDPRLIVYATNSVDENFFRSTVSCLAAARGHSSVRHFSLGQLQGASLDVAADIISGSLQQAGDTALFIAAERWPLPYPRTWGPQLLADGAAALWFECESSTGLQYLGSVQRGFDPFVVVHPGSQNMRPLPHIALEAIAQAALETVATLLLQHGIGPDEIDGWIACTLDDALDREVRQQVGARPRHVLHAPAGDGYLCAAAAPSQLVQLLDQVLNAQVPHASLWVSWNASLGGTVTASLWRACHEGKDS